MFRRLRQMIVVAELPQMKPPVVHQGGLHPLGACWDTLSPDRLHVGLMKGRSQCVSAMCRLCVGYVSAGMFAPCKGEYSG